MPAVLALLSSLLWGTSDFLGGTATRRLPGTLVVGMSQGLGFAGLLPIAALTGGFAASTGYLGWSAAAGVVGLVALQAFYRALATGTMGVVAPVASIGVAVPVVVGLASGESPRPAQLLGAGVAIAGVVLAGGPQLRADPIGERARPLLLAALAAAGFGLVLVLLAEGSRSSVVMTLLTTRGVTVGALLVGMLVVRRWSGGKEPVPLGTGRPGQPANRSLIGVAVRNLPLLAVIGACDTGGNGLYAVASRSGLLSVVAVLASLYPAVTALLARWVHGERLRRTQLAGVGAVLAGAALLAGG